MKEDLERDLDLLSLAEGGAALSAQRKAELESAIADSPELAAQFEATRLVLEYVDQMPMPEPSMSFGSRLERRLDAIDEAREHPWWHRWMPTAPMGWALGAVAAAAVAAIIAVTPPPRTRTPGGAGFAQVELLEVAENLELFQDFDVIDHLDVLDDLDVIEQLEAGEPG